MSCGGPGHTDTARDGRRLRLRTRRQTRLVRRRWERRRTDFRRLSSIVSDGESMRVDESAHLDDRLSWWLSANDKAGKGTLQMKVIVVMVDNRDTRNGIERHFIQRPCPRSKLETNEGYACYLIDEAWKETDSGKSIRLPKTRREGTAHAC